MVTRLQKRSTTLLATALLLSTFAAPLPAAAAPDLVTVVGTRVAGSNVEVTLSNTAPEAKTVEVTVLALVGLLPARATWQGTVAAGATVQVPVGFGGAVSAIVIVGISDQCDPIT